MNGTFEKRLKTVPIRKRLGKANKFNYSNDPDLRNKLNQKIRTKDARSIIRNRNQRGNTSGDARTLLRRGKQRFVGRDKIVPFIIPVRTVKNERFGKPSIQRNPRLNTLNNIIPDFLDLPLKKSLDFWKNSASNLGNLNLVSNTGSRLSPIQGFRLEVRNLQPSVTLDDVFELFSSIGTLRLCTLTRPGHADIVFNHPSHALQAVDQYNGRELDGRPMHVSLITPISDEGAVRANASPLNSTASRLNVSRDQTVSRNLIRNSQNRPKTISVEIDADVVRKALFNVAPKTLSSNKDSGPIAPNVVRRPVDFNVCL